MYLSKRNFILLVSSLMSLFAILTYGVLTHASWLGAMDQFGQVHLRTAVTPNKTFVLAWMTDVLGIYLPVLFTLGYIFLILKKRHYKQLIWFISSIALSAVVIPSILKGVIDRPRPTPRLVIETTSSFPSGHSTSASFFYWFILFIVLSWGVMKLPKVMTMLATLIVILFVMWTRIYLNVHYLSDVSAGFILGLMNALTFWYIGQHVLQDSLSVEQKLVDDSIDVC